MLFFYAKFMIYNKTNLMEWQGCRRNYVVLHFHGKFFDALSIRPHSLLSFTGYFKISDCYLTKEIIKQN